MGTPQSHGKKHPWFCHRQVFRQQIWMRHFGVKSQKATCLWSNSWHIQHLDNGPVPKALRDASQPLAKTYHDQGGVKRCTGKKGNSRNRSCLVQCSFKKIEDFCGSRGHLLTCGPAVSILFWCPRSQGVHKSFWVQDCFHIAEFVRWSHGLAFRQGLSFLGLLLLQF